MKLIIFGVLLMIQTPFSFADEPLKTKADTNREVVRTYSRIYFETGEFSKASDMLLPYLKEDDQDGNLWVLLGQALIPQKRITEACYAFQRASAQIKDDENRIFATYLFADCLNREDRAPEAKILLERLRHEPEDLGYAAGNALDLINKGAIRSGQPLPPFQKKGRGKWRLSGAFGAGFDTNVLLVEEAVINDTPVSNRGSYFITPALQAGYAGQIFGTTLDSRYVLAYTDYLNSAATAFNSLYQRADFSFGSGPIRWGVFADTLFLNRSPFSLYDWESGLSYLDIIKASSDYAFTLEIPVRYQKYILDSSTTSDNDRTGGDLQVKANARWMDGSDRAFNVQVALEDQYSKGKNYRLGGLDIPISYLTPVPLFSSIGFLNTFSVEAQGQKYFQSDTSRRDLLLKAGAGVLKTIKSFNLTIDYSYQRNNSSVDSAKYHKSVMSLQLSRDFL